MAVLLIPACLVGCAEEVKPIQKLVDDLGSDETRERYKAAKQISKTGINGSKNENQAAVAAEALAKTLSDSDRDVRYYSVKALDNLESEAAPAVAALTHALGDENEQVRYRVAKALGNIGPEAKEAVPALEQVLKDDSSDTVREAATAAVKRISRITKG